MQIGVGEDLAELVENGIVLGKETSNRERNFQLNGGNSEQKRLVRDGVYSSAPVPVQIWVRVAGDLFLVDDKSIESAVESGLEERLEFQSESRVLFLPLYFHGPDAQVDIHVVLAVELAVHIDVKERFATKLFNQAVKSCVKLALSEH